MDPSELTIEQVEKAINFEAMGWHGNCFGVATSIVQAGLVEGTAVYGHYLGYIDPDGYWEKYAGHPFVQHGWVLLDDGRILDPTRWSFENEEPYLALFTEDDEEFGDYDEGGEEWREAMRMPFPDADPNDDLVSIELPPECAAFVNSMLPEGVTVQALSIQQVMWIANAPYDSFGPFVAEIYKGISEATSSAFIPLDNQRRAKREFQVDL